MGLLAKMGRLLVLCRGRLETLTTKQQPQQQQQEPVCMHVVARRAPGAGTVEAGVGRSGGCSGRAEAGPVAAAAATADAYDYLDADDEDPPAPRSSGSSDAAAGSSGSSGVGAGSGGAAGGVGVGRAAAIAAAPSAATAATLAGEHAATAELGRTLGVLQLTLAVLENATFTCVDSEVELLGLQLPREFRGLGGGGGGAEPAAAAGDAGAGEVSFVELLVGLVPLLRQHVAPSVQVQLHDCAEGGSSIVPDPGSWILDPGSSVPAAAGPGSSRIQLGTDSSGCAPHATAAWECVHLAVAVLMNVTHQHEDGISRVAEVGGLEAVGALLRACCLPFTYQPLTCQPPSAPAAVAVPRASRASILRHLEVASVCLGLLINLTSMSAANRETLRGLDLGGEAERTLGEVGVHPGSGARVQGGGRG